MTKGKDYQSLIQKLNRIGAVFDIRSVNALHPQTHDILAYYHKNRLSYTLLHDVHGFVHMGVSRDGSYKPEDLTEQAKYIAEKITDIKAKRILELATGRGANSLYLAKRFPNAQFTGFDVSDTQLKYAKAHPHPNVYFEQGDYHDLQQYRPNSFDLVFVIEALCHSTRKKQVMREVSRIVRNNGLFVIVDGYSTHANKTKAEVLASNLTAKAMAVDQFDDYTVFRRQLGDSGFVITQEHDWSSYILPSLRRFERHAKLLFHIPVVIARAVNRMIPAVITRNAIAGYLLPDLIELGTASYMVTVAKKK